MCNSWLSPGDAATNKKRRGVRIGGAKGGSDSDASGDTNSLSAESGQELRPARRAPAPPPVTQHRKHRNNRWGDTLAYSSILTFQFLVIQTRDILASWHSSLLTFQSLVIQTSDSMTSWHFSLLTCQYLVIQIRNILVSWHSSLSIFQYLVITIARASWHSSRLTFQSLDVPVFWYPSLLTFQPLDVPVSSCTGLLAYWSLDVTVDIPVSWHSSFLTL